MDEDINRFQPTVSANDLVSPKPPVAPPAPVVEPQRNAAGNLVSNVADTTGKYIQAQTAEAQKQNELIGLIGAQQFDGASQRQELNKQYNLPQNLTRLQDINTQLTRANTQSDLTKSRIEGAAGQTMGQAQREVTQQDRENAIRNSGLAAEAAVLQGSIETATTLVNQGMSDFYQERQMKNQNMLTQLDYYSGKVDQQTQQLIDAEKRKYTEDQAKVQRVLESVDTALATGAASTEEMRTLTNPKATDEDRLAVAQGIMARAASEATALDREYKQAQINSANRANMGGGGSSSGADGGLSGLAQGVMNGTVDISKLTPTQYGEVMDEIVRAGGSINQNDDMVNYQVEHADRVMDQVDIALNNVSGWTAGFGSLLSKIPGTDARSFEKQLIAIKANIGFGELQAMRAASPTGGALGQVAVQELEALQSSLGSLDAGQSPEELRGNLERIKEHYNTWKTTIALSKAAPKTSTNTTTDVLGSGLLVGEGATAAQGTQSNSDPLGILK